MSFAGILGAGLLGGAANAAKGIGDRIREEAKQKREMLLQDRADERAEGIAKTANDNAVEAAKKRRIFDAEQNTINNAAFINRQNNQGAITGANTIAAQNNQGAITGANTIAAQNNQGAINIASQNNQNASTKPLTNAQLQNHMTAQVWKHVGGKVDKYGDPLPLSPEDSKLAASWNKIGSVKIQQLKADGVAITPAVVASVIAETFVRPFDVTKIKLTPEDRATANQKYNSEASTMESDISQFGMSESQIKRQWATESAIRRQPDFEAAQKAWNDNVVGINKAGVNVTQAMVDEGQKEIEALLSDRGFDPSLLIKK